LKGLPEDQRSVIELHWFEQLSFNEIAGIVGATAGAVRVRAHRGYVALRKQLDAGNIRLPGDVP
jgi:RNA polymerase sigma-70 factor (ECF subfamily)